MNFKPAWLKSQTKWSAHTTKEWVNIPNRRLNLECNWSVGSKISSINRLSLDYFSCLILTNKKLFPIPKSTTVNCPKLFFTFWAAFFKKLGKTTSTSYKVNFFLNVIKFIWDLQIKTLIGLSKVSIYTVKLYRIGQNKSQISRAYLLRTPELK